MPSCLGNPEQGGVWICPYCKPLPRPITCYSMQDVDFRDPAKGQVKVPCKEPCTLAGFHGKDPGAFWEHVQKAHGWDGKKLDEEPPRYLDDWVPTPVKQLQAQPVRRGPSSATRAKARAKRKKKKKRR